MIAMVDEIKDVAFLEEENGQGPEVVAQEQQEETVAGDTSTGEQEKEPEPTAPAEPEEKEEDEPGKEPAEKEDESSEENEDDKLMSKSEIDDEWDKVMTENEKVLSALNFLHEDEYDGGFPSGQLAFKNSVEKDDVFDPRKEEDEVVGTDPEPPVQEEEEDVK